MYQNPEKKKSGEEIRGRNPWKKIRGKKSKNGEIILEISKKNEDRKIPIKQMLRDEALKAFEIWNKKTDKIEY